MKESKKKYTSYSKAERMSYIREYLSSPESKYQFSKRNGFCSKLLSYWLKIYNIEDKEMCTGSKMNGSECQNSSIAELQKELSLLRVENRKLQQALSDAS